MRPDENRGRRAVNQCPGRWAELCFEPTQAQAGIGAFFPITFYNDKKAPLRRRIILLAVPVGRRLTMQLRRYHAGGFIEYDRPNRDVAAGHSRDRIGIRAPIGAVAIGEIVGF